MFGIIFDFNGTLFRDSDKHEEAWQKFASKHMGRDISQEEFDNHFHGKSNNEAAEYIFKKTFTQNEANEAVSEKEEIYRELSKSDKNNFYLIKGTIEFLEKLQEKSIPFTIATASGKDNVDFYFEEFGLERWFDYEKIVYSDGNLKSKPDPDAYQKGAAAINLKPEKCIVFEDSISGIQSAQNAGVKEVIVVSTNNNHEMLENMDVTLVIDDFTDERLDNLIKQNE